MAVLGCAALYLRNPTLAWQGRPGRCCSFSALASPLPYRAAFREARSRSDRTCISNSAAEDPNIRPAGSLDDGKDTSSAAAWSS